MALRLWKATGNVQTYFHHLHKLKETYVATKKGLSEFEEEFGIQKELAIQICKDMFTNNIQWGPHFSQRNELLKESES